MPPKRTPSKEMPLKRKASKDAACRAASKESATPSVSEMSQQPACDQLPSSSSEGANLTSEDSELVPTPPAQPRAHPGAPRPRPAPVYTKLSGASALAAAGASTLASAAHSAANFLINSPKHVTDAICSSPKLISNAVTCAMEALSPKAKPEKRYSYEQKMVPLVPGAVDSQPRSPVRGSAGAALRKAGKVAANLTRMVTKSHEEKKPLRKSRSSISVNNDEKPQRTESRSPSKRRSSSKSNSALRTDKSATAIEPEEEDVPEELPSWPVPLVRLVLANARKHHRQRSTFQARQAGEEEFRASLVLRETCSDIRLAVRAVFIMKQFIEHLEPGLTKGPAQRQQKAEEQSRQRAEEAEEVEDVWKRLMGDFAASDSD